MSFLSHLDPATRQRLMAEGEDLRLEPGTLLIRRGEAGGDVFLVESGAMEVVDARSSPPVILRVLEAGEVLGELSFLDHSPRTADVRAVAPCRVRVWRRAALEALLRRDRVFAAGLYEGLAHTGAERLRSLAATAAAAPRATTPVDAERDPIVDELLAAFAHGWQGEDPERLAAALGAMAAALAPVAGTLRAEQLGAALRGALQERMALSRTGALLLGRPPGEPAVPALAAHLVAGAPRGDTAAGRALDAALLELPGLRAPRLRAPALAWALVQPPLAAAGPVGLLGLPPAALAPALGPPAADLLPLAARPDGGLDVPALLDLLRGLPPAAPPLRAVLVEGLPDLLPDRLLRALVAALGAGLAPGGRLVLATTPPSEDLALLDHVMGWPLLPRAPEALAGLTGGLGGPAGPLRTLEAQDEVGLLLLQAPGGPR